MVGSFAAKKGDAVVTKFDLNFELFEKSLRPAEFLVIRIQWWVNSSRTRVDSLSNVHQQIVFLRRFVFWKKQFKCYSSSCYTHEYTNLTKTIDSSAINCRGNERRYKMMSFNRIVKLNRKEIILPSDDESSSSSSEAAAAASALLTSIRASGKRWTPLRRDS